MDDIVGSVNVNLDPVSLKASAELERISPPDTSSASDDPTTLAADSLSEAYRKAEDWKQLFQLRWWFGVSVLGLTALWLIWLAWTILAHGFSWWDFTLSDAVLIALIGSSTANVIGAYLIVVRFLFPASER